MVHLNDDLKLHADQWQQAGIAVPSFDVDAMRETTAAHPYWLHFGAGNLFRAVHAPIAQALIEAGETGSGVLAAETFDPDIIEQAYRPFADRCLQVVLKADGSVESTLIASVAGSFGVRAHDEEWNALEQVFTNPELQFVTVTITEKGYAVEGADGKPLPWIAPEVENGPETAVSAMGAMTALLFARFNAGGTPIAMVSTDNFSQNGDRFGAAIRRFAELWLERGFVGQDFVDWLADPTKVSFPLSMIDRITPNPAASVAAMLEERGFEDTQLIRGERGTNIAPFANAEETWYLVVEDAFPNGRPALEKAGVYVADRDTVNLADEMKVTTCLNPLHTAVATFGMLLGYESMSQAIADPSLTALAERLGYDEGLPVVADPGIFSPREFLRQVVEVRIPNPNIPDTPARISTDTSQKIPVRYGETIKKYLADPNLDVADLIAIPLAIAGWLRLLIGSDGKGTRDDGTAVAISPDPRLAEVQRALAGLSVGEHHSHAAVSSAIAPLLADASLFGADLTNTALATAITDYLVRFTAGTNTVHTVINEALGL